MKLEHRPCVARLVTHPTALHCTSTFGLSIWRMRGSRPPSFTIKSLLSAKRVNGQPTIQIYLQKKNRLLTARLPSAALAALWTSVSWLPSRKRIGSRVSLPTGRTSFSVISAKARAALRCRSTFSENDNVVKAESGEPLKKLVVVRSVISVNCELSGNGKQRRTFEVLEEISNRFTLILQQQRLVLLRPARAD